MPSHFTETEYWTILELTPDADVRMIKRAYAQRLKKVKPDDDPVGFQNLRAAYEWALEYAEQHALQSSATVINPVLPAEQETIVESASPVPVQSISPSIQHKDEIGSSSISTIAQEQDYFIPQARPAREVAQESWHDWLNFCEQFQNLSMSVKEIDALKEAIKTAHAALLQCLRDPELEALAARHEFQLLALLHCATDEALPCVRIACETVFEWREERKLLGAREYAYVYIAMERAAADREFITLLEEACHSSGLRDILRGKPPSLLSRHSLRFFDPDYLWEVRHWLKITRNTPELVRYRFAPEILDAWQEIAQRAWITKSSILWTTPFSMWLAYLFLEEMTSEEMWQHRPLLHTLAIVLLGSLVPLMLGAIPLFIYPAMRRGLIAWWVLNAKLDADRRLHFASWIAHALLTTLAITSLALPYDFAQLSLWLAVGLTILDLAFRSQPLLGLLIFQVLCALGVAKFYFNLSPSIEGIFGTCATAVIFLSGNLFGRGRHLARHFHLDLSGTPQRLRVLAAGVVVGAVQYALVEYSASLAIMLGWIWVLGAIQVFDPFLLFIRIAGNNILTRLPWVITLVILSELAFLLPGIPALHGIQNVQAMTAMALTLHTAWDAIFNWFARRRKPSKNKSKALHR